MTLTLAMVNALIAIEGACTNQVVAPEMRMLRKLWYGGTIPYHGWYQRSAPTGCYGMEIKVMPFSEIFSPPMSGNEVQPMRLTIN
jgi:hypothetical protein